jgi:hypothetical protein
MSLLDSSAQADSSEFEIPPPLIASPGCCARWAPPLSPGPTAAQQLQALLDDAAFPRFVKVAEVELMRVWSLPRTTAKGFVMSAIGEPRTLASIHELWFSANARDAAIAKLIVRRRVLDLLRGDVRRPHHESLPAIADELDDMLISPDDGLRRDPHAQAELHEIVRMVHRALACFARQGSIQARQAELVRRYALDEATYSKLAGELGCNPNALGVRIHKAMHALRRHIEACHPELKELIGRPSARSQRS